MDDIDDGLAVPDFLRLSTEERHAAWLRNPPKPMPRFSSELTETERRYRQSIEDEKAAKRAAAATRFKVLRARAAEERAERQRIKQAIRSRAR